MTREFEAELTAIVERAVADKVRPEFPDWMTMKQAMEYLNVSRPTVHKMMRKGMPYSKIGSDLRFFKSLVDKWLQDNK